MEAEEGMEVEVTVAGEATEVEVVEVEAMGVEAMGMEEVMEVEEATAMVAA